MSIQVLPPLVQPEELEPLLADERLLILDLRAPEKYLEYHIPGAVNAGYGHFVGGQKPTPGLLPSIERLSRSLSELGLAEDRPVVAYDDEGGGRAARAIWTLQALGHANCALLDGGLPAWAHEGRPLETTPVTPVATSFVAELRAPGVLATRDYVRSHLYSKGVVLLDARSADEYAGTDVRAARGGHIPGAVNLDWVTSIDPDRRLRLHPDSVLRAQLEPLGVLPDKEIIVYCQTHHRSSHSYVVLKHLGYPRVRGYAGAWSEWGNDPSLPVAI